MSSEKILAEQIHKIKTYTTNQFVDKLHECLDGQFPKAVHVFFNIDSLKKSIIDVSFIKPLLYVFEGKSKRFITAKDLNDKLGHEVLFLNLCKGIEHKLKQLKHQFYSLNISFEKQMRE
jgi:hypothetical protein